MPRKKTSSAVNLKNLDEKALASLQSDINAELQRKKKAKKREVVKEVKALLAKHGMTLDDILPQQAARKSVSRPKVKVPPKYRNKSNPAETWTGRGRKPKWVEAHLKAGGSLDDIAIK